MALDAREPSWRSPPSIATLPFSVITVYSCGGPHLTADWGPEGHHGHAHRRPRTCRQPHRRAGALSDGAGVGDPALRAPRRRRRDAGRARRDGTEAARLSRLAAGRPPHTRRGATGGRRARAHVGELRAGLLGRARARRP